MLGFFRFRIAADLFSLGAGLFLKNEEWNVAYSYLFFPVSYHQSIFVNCDINNEPRKNKKNPKRGRERPILKKPLIKFERPMIALVSSA